MAHRGERTGPVAHSLLFDLATNQPRREIERLLKNEMSVAVERLTGLLADLLNRAYMDGLRDGFQQGVEAQAARTQEANQQ